MSRQGSTFPTETVNRIVHWIDQIDNFSPGAVTGGRTSP